MNPMVQSIPKVTLNRSKESCSNMQRYHKETWTYHIHSQLPYPPRCFSQKKIKTCTAVASELRAKRVEVGSLSHYSQGFWMFPRCSMYSISIYIRSDKKKWLHEQGGNGLVNIPMPWVAYGKSILGEWHCRAGPLRFPGFTHIHTYLYTFLS